MGVNVNPISGGGGGSTSASDLTTGTLANARLDSTTTGIGFVVDEDDFSSDSATKVPTQQSVKQYITDNAGGGGGFWDSVTIALDVERSNDNSYTDVTGLTVALDASSKYLIKLFIGLKAENTGDNPRAKFKMAYSGTKDTSMISALEKASSISRSSSDDLLGTKELYISTGDEVFFSAEGHISTTTSGNLKIQAGQLSASATDSSFITAGSTIIYKKVV